MASVGVDHLPARRASVSPAWVLTTSVPVAVFLLFAFGHAQHWLETGHPTGAVLVVQELVLVTLFVTRRRPLESSQRPLHWFAAMAGSFSVLLLRPGEAGSTLIEGLALALQIVGAGVTIVCLGSLGRSFGIVAANRGPKVGGPYRFVRHPIYASYLIGWTGYLLAAPTLRNVAVLAVALFFQLQRITAEEELLGRDEAYRSYSARVAYRLVPGVW